MEQTFQELKEKVIDKLLNARELSVLLDIKNFVSYKKDELDYKNKDEYQFCSDSGKLEICEEIEKLINEKIELLDKQNKE